MATMTRSGELNPTQWRDDERRRVVVPSVAYPN